jgi:Integrase core domain
VDVVHGMATDGYDFVEDRKYDRRKIRMLNIVDEFTREALVIRVSRRLNSTDAIDVLSDLFILRGVPAHIRSDNGPEFIAKAVQAWITAVGAQTAYITPGGAAYGSDGVAVGMAAEGVPGRTVTSTASTPACGMSSSMARFSTRYGRPRF